MGNLMIGLVYPPNIQLAKFIKDYLDDVDGYPEIAMTRFYADIIGKGISVSWEDMV